MRRSVTAAALLLSSAAFAQPDVPAGFTVRQLSPLLDGALPQLEAIEDAQFGSGVIAATASNGVATIRVISPTGTITSLGSVVNPNGVKRVRLDSDDLIDGLIHFTLSTGNPGSVTDYFTLDENGVVTQRWSESGNVTYDFDFTPIGATERAVLLDSNGIDGTRLSTMDNVFGRTVRSNNSLPAGRDDTDVAGLRGDPSGLYGGEVLFVDSDCNGSGRSAVWSVSNLLGGGTYVALGGEVPCSQRIYGDLDLESAGPFGGIAFVTEQVSDEIQQVAPDGMHTTWATGFTGIDALSISPDGQSMYVADLNGIWLIRPEGNEPGPAVLATDPSASGGTQLCGSPVSVLRVIFTESVSFTDADVTITNSDAQPVAFDASGSGSQFLIIGLAEPLSGDTYTVTIADTLVSVATSQPLDGDNDGVAGADAVLTFTHACDGDIADDFGIPGSDGQVTFGDFLRLLALVGPCP